MRQVPILMYHWFRGEGEESTSQSPQLEISPERFREHLAFLRRRGYESVSLSRAMAARSRRDLPRRPIVISFDDGTRDFYEHAHPALLDHGFTATQFVVTGYVGRSSTWDEHLGEPGRPVMSWEQIRELHEAGHEIGSHTCTHRVFPELTDEEVKRELADSRSELADHLGEPPAFFAYPRGFLEPHHKQLVAEAGYLGAVGVALELKDLRVSDPFELKRVTMKGNHSMLKTRLRIEAAKWVRLRR